MFRTDITAQLNVNKNILKSIDTQQWIDPWWQILFSCVLWDIKTYEIEIDSWNHIVIEQVYEIKYFSYHALLYIFGLPSSKTMPASLVFPK